MNFCVLFLSSQRFAMKKKQETAKVRVTLLEEKIVENVILENTVIDEELALHTKEKNEKTAGYKPYAVLVSAEQWTSITPEARKLIASPPFKKVTIAKAVVVNSLPQRMVVNFYLRFNKPSIPTRMFSNRDTAIKWLRNEVSKDNSN